MSAVNKTTFVCIKQPDQATVSDQSSLSLQPVLPAMSRNLSVNSLSKMIISEPAGTRGSAKLSVMDVSADIHRRPCMVYGAKRV